MNNEVEMKILHIPAENVGLKKSIGGIKSILLEQVKYENKLKNIESKILIYDKIEEKNSLFVNKNSIKEDILNYKPNFVIFDGFWVIQHCFIAKFLNKNNIKYFIKPHGGFNIINYKSYKIKFVKKLIARILFFNNYVKNSNGLIFLNEMERENSIYRKREEFILPNGIEKLNIESNIEKEKSRNINFIFLGRIDIFNKKLDILFQVLLKNKEYFANNGITFNFYGNGNNKDMKIFNEYLKGIPEIIKYYGAIYGQEKYKVLQKNDIFILLSKFEGMPMSILEALSVGVPCFISKETGMGDYIEKYNAGWINKKDEDLFENLKKCIEEFKNHSKYYKDNSLKSIENFYWENIMKNYLKEYIKIK